jgi:hypothetical protein
VAVWYVILIVSSVKIAAGKIPDCGNFPGYFKISLLLVAIDPYSGGFMKAMV